MKRVNVPIPADLYRELQLTKELYGTSITELVIRSIRHSLMFKRTVWGFTKKDELDLKMEAQNEKTKKSKS